MPPVLRDYQLKIKSDIKEKLCEGYKSVVAVCATASGKTVVFSDIAQSAASKNKRVLILTHRAEIAKQTLKKLYDFDCIAGQIASGKPMTRELVQVGMVQTCANRLERIKRPDLIIMDEAHHFVSPTFKKVIANFADVPRLGFTATPARLDGTGLGSIFQSMVLGPSISELVKRGHLSYPRVFRPPHELETKFKITAGDYDKKQQTEFIRQNRKIIVGDAIEHYRKYLNGNPAACFCTSHENMKEMLEHFNDANIKAVKVFSGMPDTERERALKGIADGTYQMILSVDILGEGVDVPGLYGVFMLRRTTSITVYLQQCGRALRTAPGKECAYIFDHAGNVKLHGHVLADRDWSLDHGKRNAKKDKVPVTTTCPNCFAIWPGEPAKCFDCNFEFALNEDVNKQQRKAPEQIRAELIEMLPEGFADADKLFNFALRMQTADPKLRQKAALSMAYQMKDEDAIKAMGKVLGYKQGWSHWAYKHITKR